MCSGPASHLSPRRSSGPPGPLGRRRTLAPGPWGVGVYTSHSSSYSSSTDSSRSSSRWPRHSTQTTPEGGGEEGRIQRETQYTFPLCRMVLSLLLLVVVVEVKGGRCSSSSIIISNRIIVVL